MKNELNWETAEDGNLPMKLEEQGFNVKGRSALFFYVSGVVAVSSMVWVIVLSIKLLTLTRSDQTVPAHYTTIALICLIISVIGLRSFYKLIADRMAHHKSIDIRDGMVHFHEEMRSGNIDWQEKLKKFEGVFLKHYSYRGVDSWYIALVHSDKSKSFPIFAPDYDSRLATEEEKKKLLAQYGTRLGLITHFEKPERKQSETADDR